MLHIIKIGRLWLLPPVWFLFMAVTPVLSVAALPAQQVVDRIVARIEGDIIALSEIRELGAYQQLLEEKVQPDDQLLSEIIEQWALNVEATAAQLPPAAAADVDREVARIEKRFPNAQAYEQRLTGLNLTRKSVRDMIGRQIFLSRYMDYKFRPAAQVDDAAIEAYYEREFVPAFTARQQTAPPALDSVREQIRELLVQRGISERATAWFQETKSRLNIEIVNPASSSTSPSAGRVE
jgi:hypothetical protein